MRIRLFQFAVVFCVVATISVAAQPKAAPATIFRDSDGNLISNNEFVDIRMANPSYPDATLMKTLDDGTVEFRLQKIPQEGMRAPDFVFTSLDGKSVSASDLRGKVVVLNFWFIGCPVCRAMKPRLNEFKKKFEGRDDVVFIAATADPPGEVARYARTEQLDYVQAAGAGTELKKFFFSGYPRNIVVSKAGEIVYWRTTVKAWDKFEAVVREELAK